MSLSSRYFSDSILAAFTAYIQRRWQTRIEHAKTQNKMALELECREYWFSMIMLDKLSWVCVGATKYKRAMTREVENVRWFIFRTIGIDPLNHKDFAKW